MPNVRSPKLEILELRDDFIKFILSETDISVANALRRVMIAEVCRLPGLCQSDIVYRFTCGQPKVCALPLSGHRPMHTL